MAVTRNNHCSFMLWHLHWVLPWSSHFSSGKAGLIPGPRGLPTQRSPLCLRAAFKCWNQALDDIFRKPDVLHNWKEFGNSLPSATSSSSPPGFKDYSEEFLSKFGIWGCLQGAVISAKIAQWVWAWGDSRSSPWPPLLPPWLYPSTGRCNFISWYFYLWLSSCDISLAPEDESCLGLGLDLWKHPKWKYGIDFPYRLNNGAMGAGIIGVGARV